MSMVRHGIFERWCETKAHIDAYVDRHIILCFDAIGRVLAGIFRQGDDKSRVWKEETPRNGGAMNQIRVTPRPARRPDTVLTVSVPTSWHGKLKRKFEQSWENDPGLWLGMAGVIVVIVLAIILAAKATPLPLGR